jgi:hypothetical protein
VKESNLTIEEILILIQHGATIGITLAPSGKSALWRGVHPLARGTFCGTFALPWNDPKLELEGRVEIANGKAKYIPRFGLKGRDTVRSMRILAKNRDVTLKVENGAVTMWSLGKFGPAPKWTPETA